MLCVVMYTRVPYGSRLNRWSSRPQALPSDPCVRSMTGSHATVALVVDVGQWNDSPSAVPAEASMEKPPPFMPALPVRPIRQVMARDMSHPAFEVAPPTWLPPRPTSSMAGFCVA